MQGGVPCGTRGKEKGTLGRLPEQAAQCPAGGWPKQGERQGGPCGSAVSATQMATLRGDASRGLVVNADARL